MTVREAADRYIEYLRRKKGGKESTTARSYASTFNLFCDHFEVLNSENVIAFLSRYQNPQTKNKMLWHLTALARRFPDPETIHAIEVQPYDVDEALPEVISPDIEEKVYQWVKNAAPDVAAVLQLMRKTGMRVGEVLALKPSSLTTQDGVPGVKFRGKGGRYRFVPFSQTARNAWEALCKISEYERKWKMPSYRQVYFWLGEACRNLMIPKIRTHWFRHTVATKLINKGKTYEEVADLLGNSVEKVRRRYSRLDAKTLSTVTALLEDETE